MPENDVDPPKEEKEDYIKKRDQLKDLITLEFGIFAFVGLLIGIFQVDFNSLHLYTIPSFILVMLFSIVFIIFFIFPLFYSYIANPKGISKEQIDLCYKLLFLQVILTIGMIPLFVNSLPVWSIITIAIYLFGTLFLFTGLIIYSNKKRKKDKTSKKA